TIVSIITKGVRTDVARHFTRDAHDLGIQIHGTCIVGLPGETRQTTEDTIAYACDIDPATIQVSIAAPYPGTALFRQAQDNGWLAGNGLLDADGVQKSALSYPHLPDTEIFAAVERFYRRFYFRPRKMTMMAAE